jgi:hypothetical protein
VTSQQCITINIRVVNVTTPCMCLLYCDDGYETVPTVLFIFTEKYLLVPNVKRLKKKSLRDLFFYSEQTFVRIFKLFLSPLSYTGNKNKNISLNICGLRCLIYKRYLPRIKAIFKWYSSIETKEVVRIWYNRFPFQQEYPGKGWVYAHSNENIFFFHFGCWYLLVTSDPFYLGHSMNSRRNIFFHFWTKFQQIINFLEEKKIKMWKAYRRRRTKNWWY